MRRSLSAIVAAMTVVTGIAVSGCGGEERAYALPQQFCGISVKSKLLEPFLPEGEKLHQNKSRNGPSLFCTAYVDGNVVLGSRGEWHKSGETAMDAAADPGPKPFGGGKYTVWDRGASAAFPCVVPDEIVPGRNGSWDEGAEVFTLEVDVPTPDEQTEAAMKKFIVPYAKAYREKLPCEGR